MDSSCPNRVELEGFVLGNLPRPLFARVVEHIEGCAACEAALRTLDGVSDALVCELRHPADRFAVVDEPVPTQLMNTARAAHRSRDASHRPSSDCPRRLGKFELLEELGLGAFGYVFRARDTELDRTVAIKIPRSGSFGTREEIDRFLREARSAAQLKHCGIVLLYGTGQIDDGTCYLVEEFIRGATLADQLKSGRPKLREAAQLVAEIADALDYAHQHGVIHRDIKPSNIMIDEEGRPHVMDFGLAKRETEEVTMTIEGQVMGTPAYMSPEQACGQSHQVDARSDIYSLGVVLYELLTGEPPFRGNRRTLIQQVIEDEPRPPRRLNHKIPRDLETICLKAMAKAPAHRYATARELADDLRRFLGGEPIRARPVAAVERLWRWCRRNPVAASLLVAVSLASSIGLVDLSRLSAYLVRRSALDSAAMQAEILEKVNAFYSSVIVDRLGHHGIVATSEYASKETSIPLPATFLTELGALISCSESGMRVRHYSDYPFRSRRDGGPRDEFERVALQHFRSLPAPHEQPDEPFFAFEDLQGVPVLRFAVPRRMQASCVRCHNTHDESTKTDWKVGDVRGVLEIIRPLDRDIVRTRRGLRATFMIMGSIWLLLLGMAALIVVLDRRRRSIRVLTS